ncbi:uncharacterized protein C8R40DRAFT_1111257 [Lentinula edodes]|uniref:uncharacterized protein n=1 Tax=Lentinula edodes TaxID=5353 RepID=UPI001E8E7CB8|nr:uncharacterized protein C8R40DRAFT_1111257 [Lentinula edodes]KAH7874089.1 hypothetical protein C8R40DRAFT_1111257 [Lentinula edodes]
MAGQCTICLSNMNDPVCIPCGHLYCSQCLLDCISSSSEDGYNALCPTCRASFPIVSPELTCLPKYVHRYITPSIRRVYLDTSAVQTLQQKLTASQNQVKNLKKESERLMSFCEKYQNASNVHADGEAKANLEVERLTRLLREQKLATQEAREEVSEWREKHEDLKEQLEQRQKKSSRKRTSNGRDRPQNNDESPDVTPPTTPRRRVIRDLPNRPNKKLKPIPSPERDFKNPPSRLSAWLFVSDSE